MCLPSIGVYRQLVVIVKGCGQLAYCMVGVLWRAWLEKLDLKMAETCAVDILERVISELSHLDQTVSGLIVCVSRNSL